MAKILSRAFSSKKMRELAEKIEKDKDITCTYYQEPPKPGQKYYEERIEAFKNGVVLIIRYLGLEIKEISLNGKSFPKKDCSKAINKLKAA